LQAKKQKIDLTSVQICNELIENMLKNIRHNIISVYKTDNGIFAGCGYGVIEKGFVGLFDIIVKEEFRGKGYGKEIVETILAKAEEAGIIYKILVFQKQKHYLGIKVFILIVNHKMVLNIFLFLR